MSSSTHTETETEAQPQRPSLAASRPPRRRKEPADPRPGPATGDRGQPAHSRAKPKPKLENTVPDSESLAGLDTSKPNWWRRLTECDPISLEPLNRLRFPPFELGTDATHATYFDGRMLANYLVSTGSFLHPISRRDLTREECVRLDDYLRQHRLGNAGVLHAFDHRDEYKNQVSPENQVRQLQEAAASLLHNLYEGSLRAAERGGDAARGRGGPRAPRAATADPPASAPMDDELVANFDETIALGGALLESLDDFPSLGAQAVGAPAAATTSAAPLTASWTAARAASHAAVAPHTAAARPEEFPELGNGGGGRGGRGARPAASVGATTAASGPSLLSRWANSNAAAALLSGRARSDDVERSCEGDAAGPAPPSVSAPLAGLPPAPPRADDFPALGGATGAPRPAASTRTSAAAPARWVAAAVKPAPARLDLGMGTASALPVAAPPQHFEAQPEEFPTLGATLTSARAASSASVPTNRDELIARNKALMAALAASARRSGHETAVADFRGLSAGFQRGEVSSFAYLKQFRELFGDDASRRLFPELVLLMPDQQKRSELAKVDDVVERTHTRILTPHTLPAPSTCTCTLDFRPQSVSPAPHSLSLAPSPPLAPSHCPGLRCL